MRDHLGVSSLIVVAAALSTALAAAQSGAGGAAAARQSAGGAAELAPIEPDVRLLPYPGEAAVVDVVPGAAGSALEEVVVIGEATLRSLRVELLRAEDRFHDLFNTLNGDDQFDIHCHVETRTGTRISQRVCKPNFVDQATAVEGQAYLATMRGEIGGARLPAQTAIAQKNVVLRDKLRALASENAELREAILDLAERRRDFDAARRRLLDARGEE